MSEDEINDGTNETPAKTRTLTPLSMLEDDSPENSHSQSDQSPRINFIMDQLIKQRKDANLDSDEEA